MKKAIWFLLPALIVGTLAGFRMATPAALPGSPSPGGKGYPIPADLTEAVKRSCMPCHSNDGRKPAKILLNFSKWDHYGPFRQRMKIKAICKYVENKKMPPAQFIESSPELAPTPAIRERFCKWREDIRK